MTLAGVVFVVFLVLKLTGNIDWSWWIVTLPLWIGAAIALTMAVVVGGIAGIIALFKPKPKFYGSRR